MKIFYWAADGAEAPFVVAQRRHSGAPFFWFADRIYGVAEEVDTSKLAAVFYNMRQRCNNPNSEKYPVYGGRGIRVRWSGLKEFRTWAIRSGYRPGLTIERIDVDGDYCPENCTWIDHAAQAWNKQSTLRLTAFGETKPINQWLDDPRCKVGYMALSQRVSVYGWDHEEAITLPPQPNGGPRAKGSAKECPSGHDLSKTRKWNKRGDYQCSECARLKAKAHYAANRERILQRMREQRQIKKQAAA